MSRCLLGQLPGHAISRQASSGITSTSCISLQPSKRTSKWTSTVDGKGTVPRRWAGTATRSQLVVNRSKTRASMPVGTGAGSSRRLPRTFATTTRMASTTIACNGAGSGRVRTLSLVQQRPRASGAGLDSRLALSRISSRYCSAHARAGKGHIMADRDVLPDNVKPIHYTLSLMDLEFKNWTYQGRVTIDTEIVKPTKELVLNSLALKLHNAKVKVEQNKDSQSFTSSNFSYDEKSQRVTITFDQELPVSKKASFAIDFEGIMNSEMAGFSRSKYKPTVTPAKSVPSDGESHYMFSTQFEACDARRAFPCFDEPNLKATFDFEVEIPEDLVALSNMPVKETRRTKDGWNMVSFDTSPIMSSYLLAWAIGDFEYIEAFTDRRYNGKQIPVRVYTTRGLKEQGQYALEHAPKIIDYFSEVFDIDYPLPKSDLIAVHEFAQGAMENWGLVTYRTTQVLFDEKTSDPRFRNSIAYVVAHELAHQWFGNLVTMDWWDELWLNEGFATWVGWYAIDYLHPEWEIWAQFVNEDMESAFRLDGIRASHPIHVPVRDALDINQIFDAISYSKGSSAIRMLANIVGVKTFLKGVSDYLKAHAYGNAKTKALWDALSKASGKDVNSMMDSWITKIGHPVVTVAEEPGQISVTQNRFLNTGDVKPDEDTTTWYVPLGLEGKTGVKGVDTQTLTTKEDTIRGIDDDFYKLNSDATGFFRVNYPPARLQKLSKQLDRLSVQDKIGIISSTADLAFAGNSTTANVLTFLQGFEKETHPLVWRQIINTVGSIKSVFSEDEDLKNGIEKFTLKLIHDVLQKAGWDFPAGEDYLKGNLRKDLIVTAVGYGDEEVLTEAKKRFDAWAQDPNGYAMNPSLRSAVWRAGIIKEPARAVEILKKEWFETKSIDGKMFCLYALAAVKEEDLLNKEVIPMAFNKEPPSQAVPTGDSHILANGLAVNPVGRKLMWNYMKNNWDVVSAKLDNPVVEERFIRLSLAQFTDESYVDDIDAFFKNKDTHNYNRSLRTAMDKVRGRAAYRKRDAASLREWFSANGYL